MQILRARRIDAKSQWDGATINSRPVQLITIKYDCTLAIKRDSLFVRGKDERVREISTFYHILRNAIKPFKSYEETLRNVK